MDKQLIIVGIDPGTTVGYAALSLEGKEIEIASAKHLALGTLITKLNSLGFVLVVASDKHPMPGYVSTLATKLGARLFGPDKDVKSIEKRSLVNTHGKNSHEADALYAAALAFSRFRPLLSKIDIFIEREGKQDIADRLRRLVIISGLPIRSSAELLESKDILVKEEMAGVEARDFAKSYYRVLDSYLRANREKDLMRQQIENMRQESSKRPTQIKVAIDPGEKLKRKDKQILELFKENKKLKRRVEKANTRYRRAIELLKHSNQYVPARMLHDLGHMQASVDFASEDIVFVEDATIVSKEAFKRLRGIKAIVSRKRPSADHIPWVDGKNIKTTVIEDIALLDKRDFERALDARDMLQRVLNEYKKGR